MVYSDRGNPVHMNNSLKFIYCFRFAQGCSEIFLHFWEFSENDNRLERDFRAKALTHFWTRMKISEILQSVNLFEQFHYKMKVSFAASLVFPYYYPFINLYYTCTTFLRFFPPWIFESIYCGMCPLLRFAPAQQKRFEFSHGCFHHCVFFLFDLNCKFDLVFFFILEKSNHKKASCYCYLDIVKI